MLLSRGVLVGTAVINLRSACVHIQLCPTLCDPMGYIAHQPLLSMEYSR